MNYKLLKDLPDVEAGAVKSAREWHSMFTTEESRNTDDESFCNARSNWFAPTTNPLDDLIESAFTPATDYAKLVPDWLAKEKAKTIAQNYLNSQLSLIEDEINELHIYLISNIDNSPKVTREKVISILNNHKK